MSTISLKRQALFGSTALVAVALLASQPAFAQDTKTAAAAAADDAETIVVTGTLIKNPNLILTSPVNVIGEQTIAIRQINSAEELVRDLPGVVPGIGSAVNNGNGGAATVNLRGLGDQRNLTLIDGDRIVPFGADGIFDLNNVPLALVQRVDVLTGGASTTYGADAVSGVVNFVTKQNFTGFDARVTYGLTERGDGQRFRADVTVGGNFADGKGNAVLSMGYQKVDPVYQSDRGFSLFQVSSTNGRAAGGSLADTPTSFKFNSSGAIQPNRLQPNATGTGFVNSNPDGFNFAPYNIYQTPYERFNIFGQAKYEIAENIEVYGRALFSKNSVTVLAAPSGIFGTTTLNININNPFISAGQRATICSLVAGLDCSQGSTQVFNLSEVYRRAVELGPRVDTYVSTVFDYKFGVRGNITDSIRFDVYGSYGQSNQVRGRSGYVLNSRIQQALLADNTTTCRTTTNNCVPLNLFGPTGSITPAMNNFIQGVATVAVDTGLGQVHGIISGDLPLTLPSASHPISFAVGAEYRNYTYRRNPDSLNETVGELGGAGSAILRYSGNYSVKEAFAEVNVPLVEDKPLFEALTLEAGIRQSSYKTSSGNKFDTTTWKTGLGWSPVAGLKLRGSYNHAVRAPNLGELFAPQVVGLSSLAADPCAGTKPVGNANLTAVCIAQGATAGQIGFISEPNANQINSTSGGNPNLRPEVADTFTIGGVIAPTFAPGLTLTVDYFNVKINNAVTSPTPSDVINSCFNNLTAASATSAACTGIKRNTSNGSLSGGNGLFGGLPRLLSNLGHIATSGVDVNAAFTRDIGFAKLNLNFNGTYTISNKFKATPTSLDRECVGMYSTNCDPQAKWQHSFRTGLDFGKFDVSLLWRHFSAMRYEDNLNIAGTAREVAPRFSGVITGFGDLVGQNLNFNKIRAYEYFDLAAGVRVVDNISINFLVANMFNVKPPIVGAGSGSTAFNNGNTFPSTYDVYGRAYRMTVGVKF